MCLLSKCIPAALRGGKSILNAGKTMLMCSHIHNPCIPLRARSRLVTMQVSMVGEYRIGWGASAGLLTTEAGTLGRFSGNIVMSLVARITGVETQTELVQFAQALYGLFAALLLAIGVYMLCVWRRLTT